MKTLRLTVLPVLLFACRTSVPAVNNEIVADPAHTFSLNPNVGLEAQNHQAHKNNCVKTLALHPVWAKTWGPYGVWNDLLSFSPEGDELVLAEGVYSPFNYFVNAQTGETIDREPHDSEQGWINPNGTILKRDARWDFDVRSIGQEERFLAVTDTDSGEILFELSGLNEVNYEIWLLETHVRTSPNGEWLVTFGTNNAEFYSYLWHIPSHRMAKKLNISPEILPYWWTGSINNSTLSDDGVLFYTQSDSATLARIDLRSGDLKTATLPETGLTTAALSTDQETLFVVGLSGNLQRINADTLKDDGLPLESKVHFLNQHQYAPGFQTSPLAHSQDSRLWASLDEQGSVVIRNTCGDKVLAEITEPQLDENAENGMFSTLQTYALAFDSTGSQLAVAREGELSVWAIEVLD
jgi:WD40 repeat protein